VIVAELPLRGAGGEPVSFARTVYSHGVARLLPAHISESPLTYSYTLRVDERIVDFAVRESGGKLVVESPARLSKLVAQRVRDTVVRMFRLDTDLSIFYARIAGDERLAWAAQGAGRMLASPTVFEDVVKTICTTNCAWSGTVRMTQALARLGGGAFPSAALLARTPDAWYKDVARMGYRGPYIRAIAKDVASGALDLEALLPRGARSDWTDEEVEEALLSLPGVGPYAAAHVMQLLSRHQNLVLDSWTRPKFLRLTGKKRATDTTIRRAFARYREYAGLAFWLFLTRDWIDESSA
jgi:3-methyladenine DNA glycosylase/8-oxoguanine DNA glycosylase